MSHIHVSHLNLHSNGLICVFFFFSFDLNEHHFNCKSVVVRVLGFLSFSPAASPGLCLKKPVRVGGDKRTQGIVEQKEGKGTLVNTNRSAFLWNKRTDVPSSHRTYFPLG